MRVVGIDGCRAGWCCVALDGGGWRTAVVGDIADAWTRFSDAELILIDIPIGLRDGGSESRRCEPLARKLLGRRASCVFTPPLRPVLQCTSYAEASARNFELSGRKLTRQAWGITAKIREVDQLLAGHPAARETFRESHPELLFRHLNAGVPMGHPKKTQAGRRERVAVLARYFPGVDEVLGAVRSDHRKGAVADDDVVDALVEVVCARQCVDEGTATLPETPEHDARGLPMEMVYPRLDRVPAVPM